MPYQPEATRSCIQPPMFVGDANTQTPEYKAFIVNVEKA